MLRRCTMARRCLWLAVPFVAGHLGCLAIPAATIAIGAPILMPICGQEPPLAPAERATVGGAQPQGAPAQRTRMGDG